LLRVVGAIVVGACSWALFNDHAALPSFLGVGGILLIWAMATSEASV
jgi:hypothetical protein